MVFRKSGTKELVYFACKLKLIEHQIINFLLYVAYKDREKDVYSVPIGVMRKYLNSSCSLSKFQETVDRLTNLRCIVIQEDGKTSTGSFFDSIKLNRSAVLYTLAKDFKPIFKTINQPTNPFVLKCFSSKYAISLYSICSYFKKECKVPPMHLEILLEYFILQETVFKNSKYFVYRIIKKSIKMASEKSDLALLLGWDKANKTINVSVGNKGYHNFFSDQTPSKVLLHTPVDKKFQKDFFEILCAIGIPKSRALSLVREYYYLNEESLTKFTALFKTTPQNILFVYRWLQ